MQLINALSLGLTRSACCLWSLFEDKDLAMNIKLSKVFDASHHDSLLQDYQGVGNEIGRQILRTRRNFRSTVFSADGT